MDFEMGFVGTLMTEPVINSIPSWDAFSYSSGWDTDNQCQEIPSIPVVIQALVLTITCFDASGWVTGWAYDL